MVFFLKKHLFFLLNFLLINLLIINCSPKKEKNELTKNIITLTLYSYLVDSPYSVYAIKDLDVSRFVGTWKEFKRIDNDFQAGLKNVTAEYAIINSNSISVKNIGFSQTGNLSIIEGVGVIKNPEIKGFLKVSFSPLFYADYYVLKIDNSYKNALIGGPIPNILWILSKDTTVSEEIEKEYSNYAKSIGYNSELLKQFR
ncbi:MAG: lipocalin family protein [Leptospiraceae bacterium]|nr:lipocalin family protein [Leptospiraceae bacterium]